MGYPQYCVLERLKASVLKYPDKVLYNDTAETVTFRQADELSDRIGSFLLSRGATKRPVVVMTDRSVLTPVCFFGAVKAACFYAPLDHTVPATRMEQVLSVIDSMPRVEAEWVQNKNERRTRFAEILKGDDYSLILCMMKGLYEEKGRRSNEGKRLMSADERAFSTARQLLRQEFSTVLGIPEDSVEEFIQSRLAGRK